jgi:phenylalanyl-tRNA synthetase beta chain
MDSKEILHEVMHMIVGCLVSELTKLIGKKMTATQLEDTLFLLKAEVEKMHGDEIEIEINPDRQDMLSTEGIARAIRAFLGIQAGLPEFSVRKSGRSVVVEKGLEKIRPFISCAIVKGVEMSETLLVEYMHLQESLTSTHGRNRRKASIGLYVHDDIHYPVRYYSEEPSKIVFSPLGLEKEMDAPTILQMHDKGREYGYIISSHQKWPLLADAAGQILSLPPIINSNNLGRLTTQTRNIFVEVTGTHFPTVDQALNIMVTSLAERGGSIESLTIKYPDGTTVETPNLKPKTMRVNKADVVTLTGLDLKDEEIVESLEKMCYAAKVSTRGLIEVKVPKYRTDVLHPVDVIEDIAIGYGFDRIEPTMPSTMTVGKLLPRTRLKNKARDLMVGTGYQEIMSYVLTSPDLMNTKMIRDNELVETGNPKSREYSVVRNSLLPILLDFLAQNQHVDLPQKVFEVGDVVKPLESAETRVDQIPSISAVSADVRVNLTDLMNEIAFLLRGMGLENRFVFRPIESSSFISGRCASIVVDGADVGVFGEVSPEVLQRFQIGNPTLGFEMSLPANGVWQ